LGKGKVVPDRIFEYRSCPGIGIFQLKTGALLCAPVCCHGAKATYIFKIQVFFLDSILRILLKPQFMWLNGFVFS